MAKLTGKIALVTGGGSGIGAASAQALLQEGAKVAIAGRDLKKLDEVAKALGNPANLITVQADVSDQKQVVTLVATVAKKLGGAIDILVNNAGTNLKQRAFREITPEGWDKLIRTNLDGAFYCIHAVAPAMIERKDGVIINIVSTSGKRAGPLGGVAYSASKFGMAALGLCVGAEEKDNGCAFAISFPVKWTRRSCNFGPMRLPRSIGNACCSRQTWPRRCVSWRRSRSTCRFRS